MKNETQFLGDDAKRMSEGNYVLSFEKFLKVHNNFRLHFARNFFGEIYRKQPAYRKCKKAHRGHRKTRNNFCWVALRLITSGRATSDCYHALLYKAYVMMRPYASSNWEMFM
ncbi:MAG: hypothetical protein M0P64_01615 [Candidatus Pacebacteria bacterium]|jgi:hypothetical protein|nr:hypothetical protein [Candidatus Paceibacterota bacterium]